MSELPTNESSLGANPPASSSTEATIEAPAPVPEPAATAPTVDLGGTEKQVDRAEAESGTFVVADDSCEVGAETPTVVGDYQILGVLGRGAVGVVYKAWHLELKRTVALKMLLAGIHAAPRELMRFRTEAEAVARLHHPNIVQVYEIGAHNDLPFFALEYVEGGSLAQKMAGRTMPARDAAGLVEALARAMHYAHQQNILHRDLKPANVLLSESGVPKITDFGLAKRLEEGESSQTRTGTLMGTPSYMAPEQAQGNLRQIGPWSDQYALGATLYEMLTGRPPFLGSTLLDTLHQVRKKEPVPPSQLQPKTPRDLEIICLKCLQKEPGQRYAHAADLADDLKRFLSGEPIRARPVSTPERLWRWCRRNPRLAALSTAVLLLAALVAVSGGALLLRLSRERQAVVRLRDQAEERLAQAADSAGGGDIRRAKDLLQWSDPLLESAADLGDVRGRWHELKDQVELYERFKLLLDNAHFACRFGSRSQKEQGRQYCRQLLELYDAIEGKRGPGAVGLPPLRAEQQQLFKEDVFAMFLVAAQVERELTNSAEPAARQQAARQALDWLNRAEKVLPRTRALYTYRSDFYRILNQPRESSADVARAQAVRPDSAVDHFWQGYKEHLQGEAASRAGDAAKARPHYRREVAEYAALLRQRPEYFWGYFNWAAAKVELGDLEDALIGYTTCIRLSPEFPWPYNNRGTTHLRLQQYPQAIRDYSAALERNPEYVEAHTNRALAYLLDGSNLDQALKDCNRALEQAPRHAQAYWHRAECYRRRKQYDAALADYRHLLDLNANKVEVCLKRAAIYEEMKRPDDALRDYDRIAALEPKNAWALYKRALLHVSRGEYQQALADYTASIELQPRAVEPYHYRAVLYWLHLKDFDAALRDWEQVIKLVPSRPEAYRFLGMIYLGKRQYKLALRELQEALARRPDYPEVLWGKAQIRLWQGNANEALAVINPLTEKLPAGYEDTLNIRGDIYRSQGRFDAAAADYRRLIQLRPELPETYVSLALVHCKQGEPAKARECLDRMVAANPRSMAAYLRRGRFLRDRGQFAAARQDGKQAAACDPKSVLPALLECGITAAQGDYAAAVAAAERCLRQAPKDDGQVLYSAVQVWSLASAAAARAGKMELARQFADRGAALLEQTLDKGFHDLLYPEHNRMSDDPALEALRRHPRARTLLAHQPE